MITLVILGVAVLAAAAAYAMARSDVTDPVDPVAEQQALQRVVRRHPGLRGFIAQRFDRTAAGGFVVTVSFLALFGTALAVGAVLDMVDSSRGLARWDAAVARFGAAHADSTSTDVVRAVTWLGARPVVLVLLALVALIDVVRSSRPQRWEVVAFVAIVGLGEMLLVNGIKLWVHRDRPHVHQVLAAHGWSFPSGHSSAAAAAWAAAALVLGRNRSRRTRIALAVVAALIAGAVAASRALLGVHWLTDVVAGLLLGWGWFTLVAVAFGGRRQRLGAPVESITSDRRDEPVTTRGGPT